MLADRLARTLDEGTKALSIPFLPGAADAMVLLALQRMTGKHVLWITPAQDVLATKWADLNSLLPDGNEKHSPVYYPAWESLPGNDSAEDPEITGQRLTALLTLADQQGPAIIATCIHALLQLTVAPAILQKHASPVHTGDKLGIDPFVSSLEAGAYELEAEVTAQCQASVRGGLVDVWPPTEELPLRLEFYDDALESIRTFDPLEQRSVDRRKTALIPPAGEWDIISSRKASRADFTSHLPQDLVVVWSDTMAIRENARSYKQIVQEAGRTSISQSMTSLQKRLEGASLAVSIDGAETTVDDDDDVSLGFKPVGGVSSLPRDMMEPDLAERTRQTFLKQVKDHIDRRHRVCLFFGTSGALDRYREKNQKLASSSQVHLKVGALSEGFMNDELGLLVVSEDDLYGQRRSLRSHRDPRTDRRKDATTGAPIASLSELQARDYVVHRQHGIGRYLGLGELTFDGRLQEVLTIEYADEARLHVPVSQAHLLSRYVGVGDRKVTLHQLGHKRWHKETTAANLAIRDFASYLLETHAARETLKGFSYGPDTAWQHEFEASFPYHETADQERTTREVKGSMEGQSPMDRLICGDVGFGKTEVAIRAAFKAVMAGRQVGVLVPTTVLCQQHYHTFSDRMAAYPVRVEMLSRFCSRGQKDRILKDLRAGSVDILVGTHSLLQPNVKFADLGLVIIDEEQRFGVNHKETLKQMRRMVDVLTLTATPIPRTLYMSLAGLKDLSTIQTPPRRRLPIKTIVCQSTDQAVRAAILQELGRHGQAYYLHNRVMTIDKVRQRLKRIVPEARVSVAHGQMPAKELADVMESFVRGDADVLLCTTIIESGLDIPNVNTIIIDRADRFGIADLYQLRGRVGRSTRKAYAYFLLPRTGRIDPVARKRIATLKKYTDLGSGFQLALRDLELRGAGNLLGLQQSGHVAAIGFVLYCQLLKKTISNLQGKPAPAIIDVALKLDFIDLSPGNADSENAAVIPFEYIPDDAQRINSYRRIAEAGSLKEIDDMPVELVDRYGRLPAATERLLGLARLRLLASSRRITAIETRDSRIMITRDNDYITVDGRMPRLRSSGTDARIKQITRVIQRL